VGNKPWPSFAFCVFLCFSVALVFDFIAMVVIIVIAQHFLRPSLFLFCCGSCIGFETGFTWGSVGFSLCLFSFFVLFFPFSLSLSLC